MVKTEIVNVVATASVGQELDLCELGKCKDVFYDSDVYGGRVAYFKTKEMQGKVSIFLTGKMISIGTKSEKQAYQELELTMKWLAQKGFSKPVELNPKTRNIVVTADFAKDLNLERLSESLKAMYEPEQFPGSILRLNEPYKATILIFASGKAVITGLTDSAQIEPTVQRLKQLIESSQ